MRYQGLQQFSHSQPGRIGVLMTNLGTPDAPTPAALRRYLREFLSDPRVVEVPRLLWWLILHGVILRIRPRRSAKAYTNIWTSQGSPLFLHTQAQCEALQQQLGADIHVVFAMRYGKPSIASVLQGLQQAGVRKLLVLPLYPQYSAATTASTFDALSADFRQRRWLPDLRFISHYHDFEPYIDAMAEQIRQHWQQHKQADKLLFSYHGLPQRYLDAGDPYYCECHKTSRLLAEKLGLRDDEYMTSFQSRFGREEWLKPYTDAVLKALPRQQVKSVQVFCPGFSADCLETLEEIMLENRDYFIQAGGQRYEYIRALNAEAAHIQALATLIRDNLQGWLPMSVNDTQATQQRAIQMGAAD